MNIQTALFQGEIILKKNNIKSAKLDTEILMSKVINKDKKFLILNPNRVLTKENFDYFNILIQERAKNKPIAYIIRKKNFGNMNL